MADDTLKRSQVQNIRFLFQALVGFAKFIPLEINSVSWDSRGGLRVVPMAALDR